MGYTSVTNLQCCGAKEIKGVHFDGHEKVLHKVARVRFEIPPGIMGVGIYYIYTYTATYKPRGEKLTEFIQENGLGEVVTIGPEKNPNSGNMLYICVWTVNNSSFREWWIKNKKRLTKKEKEELEEE